MHISKIELENIKSHISSTLEFNRGTTAITGENGAGKTTIIEAIAWVMFDLLDYKKEDFVRRGSKKGSVRITFESGLDERDYQVYRDTGAGYYVNDPRLDTRIANKKEEVFRFLWRHLGLDAGTDLRSLFKQAIGVPQGTFTAIFLEGATERKTAFDRLLKVEEYRQAAEKLRDTARFIDVRIAGVRESIARSEGELSRAEAIEAEHGLVTARLVDLERDLAGVSESLTEHRAVLKELDAVERRIASLQAEFDRLTAEVEKGEIIVRQYGQDVEKAVAAERIVKSVTSDAKRHEAALARLGELDRERAIRDRVRGELAKVENAIVMVNADQKQLTERIAAIQAARDEIAKLGPLAAEQEILDQEIIELREQAAAARSRTDQIASVEERLARLRETFRENQDQRKEAEARSVLAADVLILETRDRDLLRDLANLRASLERDEKFQSEVRNGLCPILSEKCLNLNEGQTLEAFLTSQFSELRSRINVLEAEQSKVGEDLKASRDAERHLTALAGYRQREHELTAEGTSLQAELSTLKEQTPATEVIARQLAEANAKLGALGDPRGRIRLLEHEVTKEAEVRQNMTSIEGNLERLGNDRRVMVEQLEEFRELDQNWAVSSDIRDKTSESYRLFLANETDAASLTKRKELLVAGIADHVEKNKRRDAVSQEHQSALTGYDREGHDAHRVSLLAAERRHAEINASLDAVRNRRSQLDSELERFAEIKRSLGDDFREKLHLEEVGEATAFIRDTLKEAAPHVARNYVYHVSLEANLMYREITGNAESTLKWDEDYSISLEEDGYERPFETLSGGEQMAAALSVRLALLKQLTDIRIAFFDEPTTNLDAERRENLAVQLSRITHFDQLFVISHDETFDSYVDHVVSIGDQ